VIPTADPAEAQESGRPTGPSTAAEVPNSTKGDVMRFVVHVSMPVQKFNEHLAAGTAGDKLRQILDDIRPEAVYFTATDGKRGGYLVVDLESPSQIPSIAEPFFLAFDAEVALHPCMSPEDLAVAGLDELAAKWAR
jgi:hypothetical protein